MGKPYIPLKEPLKEGQKGLGEHPAEGSGTAATGTWGVQGSGVQRFRV